MNAIILAAGRGRRLGFTGHGRPKCTVPIGGASLIEHQVRVLRHNGVARIVVVVGYQSERVQAILGDQVDYVTNKNYVETNSLYSLALAAAQVSGDCVLVNGDVLAHPWIFTRTLSTDGNAVAYDSLSGHEDEHMKLRVRNGRLLAISKTLSRECTDGENVGVLKFDARGMRRLGELATSLVTTGREHAWAPAATNALAQEMPVHAIDISGTPWIEIDFPEDVHRANSAIWPAIRPAMALIHARQEMQHAGENPVHGVRPRALCMLPAVV